MGEEAQAPKRKNAKANKIEKEKRVNTVLTWILSGIRYVEILHNAAQNWGVSERTAKNYIAAATAIYRASSEQSREDAIAEHKARMDYIYRQCIADGDRQTALRAAQDKAKMIGAYPTPGVKIVDWRTEVIELLRNGAVTPEQVKEEFGNEGDELIIAAGCSRLQTT